MSNDVAIPKPGARVVPIALKAWLTAYNFAKQLKGLRFRTPCDASDQLWQAKPEISTSNLTITIWK